jgi:hypothetical protein
MSNKTAVLRPPIFALCLLVLAGSALLSGAPSITHAQSACPSPKEPFWPTGTVTYYSYGNITPPRKRNWMLRPASGLPQMPTIYQAFNSNRDRHRQEQLVTGPLTLTMDL